MPKDIRERFKEKFADNTYTNIVAAGPKEVVDWFLAEFQKDIEEHFVSKEALREWLDHNKRKFDDLSGDYGVDEYDLLAFITK